MRTVIGYGKMRFLRTRFLLILFAVSLYSHTPRALKESYRKGHDGSTVDGMLARLGEGTAHFIDPSSSECKVPASGL